MDLADAERIVAINLEIMDGEKIAEHFSLFDRLALIQQLTPPRAEWTGEVFRAFPPSAEEAGEVARRAGGGRRTSPKACLPRGLVKLAD